MTGDSIPIKILAVNIIPNADPALLKELGALKDECSIGIITTDCDDVSYLALDEATKKADVRVAYATSMYGGAPNATTKLAGEFIGILAAKDPAQLRFGVEAAISFIENDACFYSANDDDSIVYFAHCVSSIGSYLAKSANVKPGDSMSVLIAPPLEAVSALDAALKSADVKMKLFYGPPTQTNFGGGLLVGDQAACKAACESFAAKVCDIAQNPISYNSL